jgi:hypothetical protein
MNKNFSAVVLQVVENNLYCSMCVVSVVLS